MPLRLHVPVGYRSSRDQMMRCCVDRSARPSAADGEMGRECVTGGCVRLRIGRVAAGGLDLDRLPARGVPGLQDGGLCAHSADGHRLDQTRSLRRLACGRRRGMHGPQLIRVHRPCRGEPGGRSDADATFLVQRRGDPCAIASCGLSPRFSRGGCGPRRARRCRGRPHRRTTGPGSDPLPSAGRPR